LAADKKLKIFKNNKLHETLLELVNKSVQQLSSGLRLQTETRQLYNKIKAIEEPYRQYDKYSSFQEDLLLDSILDYFVDSRKELLMSIAEYSLCVSLMDSDEKISEQVDKSHRLLGVIQYVTHWSYISHILKKMVRSYVRYETIDRRQYDKLYSDLEEFLYNKQINLVEICPLINFDVSDYSHSIVLSDHLSIRRINNEERSLLAENLAFFAIRLNDIIETNYVIEYKFRLSKGFDIGPEIQDREYPSDLNRIFAAVITALRLYKDGAVGAHMFLRIVTLDLPIRMAEILHELHPLGLETHIGINYNLNKTEVEDFRNFWNKYNSNLLNLLNFKMTTKDKYKNIKTALNRFNSAYYKRNPEDKIVDWMISFESLFSKKDDPTDSITHKLALRSSRFSKVQSERKEFYGKLKDAYNVRSKIVHGASVEAPQMDIRSHISQCIIRYLDELISGHEHDSILESIDFD
jgi:Apea-like HEPN